MKQHIPNIVTSLNLFSGCIAALAALKGDFNLTLICMIASGVFDFCDGMIARFLGVSSPMGRELDSLADVISFGMVPSLVLYTMMQPYEIFGGMSYIAFLIVIFSAWRLAKFNIDERQSVDFIGLNTPMNSFFIISLPYIQQRFPYLFEGGYLLIILIILLSSLLISEIRLFSMKFAGLSWNQNKYRYLFLISSLFLVSILKIISVPIVLLLYFIFSNLHFSNVKS